MLRSLQKISVVLYLLLMVSIGAVFIAVSQGAVPVPMVADAIGIICASREYSAALFVSGAILVLAGTLTAFKTLRAVERKRVIVLQSPSGETVVALSAVEEYVRKVVREVSAIKCVRSAAVVEKKGLKITVSASMPADSNIQDITESLRQTIQGSVANMLGVEPKIDVRLRVSRLIKGRREEPK